MFEIIMAVEDPKADLSWVGPTIGAIGSVIIAVVGGISLVWRRRQDREDAKEDKQTEAEIAVAPKVTDGWQEVRDARAEASTYYNFYRAFENLYFNAIGALRHLVRSIRAAHPEQEFDKDVLDALAATPPNTELEKK